MSLGDGSRAGEARASPGRATAADRSLVVWQRRSRSALLLADLDVHPRVAMQILRHVQFAITMEIYTVVSSAATRDALKRLGKVLDR